MSPTLGLESQEQTVEVGAARLLLILHHFAREPDTATRALRCWPARDVSRHLTPEYYLQKLDFLLRYPSYLAYELIELHAAGVPEAADAAEVRAVITDVVAQKEPDFRTMPFRKFWRGAYERIDHVEAWWYARELVYTGIEPRGAADSPARPQKHYFLTPKGEAEAVRLVTEVEHARWYDARIRLLRRFFGGLTAAQLKALQYSHLPYRQAQLAGYIPDLAPDDVAANYRRVFARPLTLPQEDS